MAKLKWVNINNFDCYQISNTGLVRVLVSQKKGISKVGMILKFRKGGAKKQYNRVCLYKNGKSYDFYVHRLVCEHFNGKNINKKFQVAHLDGNPTNNIASNLKWASVKENHSHKKIHGTNLDKEKNPKSKISNKSAIEILQKYCLGVSSIELSESYNVSTGTILSLVSGRTWGTIGSKRLRDKAKKQAKINIIKGAKKSK